MKKILFLTCFVLFAITLSSYADSISPRFSLIYNDMPEVNKELDNLAEMNESAGLDVSKTMVNSGIRIGFDYGCFRFEYLYVIPGRVYGEQTIADTTFIWETTIEASLISMLIGTSTDSRATFNGFYIGVGYAQAKEIVLSKIDSPVIKIEAKSEIPYAGYTVPYEINVGTIKNKEGNFEVTFGLGGAVCFPQVTEDIDRNNDGTPEYEKGEYFRSGDGEAIVFRYGGFMVNLKWNF